MRRLRSSWLPFLVTSAVHLTGQLGRALDSVGSPATWEAVASGSKTLLMPALAVALLREAASPRSAWWPTAMTALLFSWAGDLALLGSGDAWFLAGVAAFGLAQAGYLATFRRIPATVTRRIPAGMAVPYAAWWLGLVGFFAATAGPSPMMAAVAGYGLLLGSMAWQAHRVHPLTAIGAASFLVSDSLIGLRGFAGVTLPAHGFWVMLTYLAGQGLIVAGLLRAERLARAATPSRRTARVRSSG